jgi:hypothetical protein
MRSVVILFLFFIGSVQAHEFTPAYPKLRQSFMAGVWTTDLKLFNKRPEITYYEFGVFNENWGPVRFATPHRIEKIPYLTTEIIEFYIKDEDVNEAIYICSTSKVVRSLNEGLTPHVSSRICSKIKR